jgi:hypothetical protein
MREKVHQRYGKQGLVWVMDRGVPTDEQLEKIRAAKPSDYYLAGAPKGRLTELEKPLESIAWHPIRPGVEAKLLKVGTEHYLLAQSQEQRLKDRAIRGFKLKRLWARLKEIRAMKRLSRDELLQKLGAARQEAGRVYFLVKISLPKARKPVSAQTFTFQLNKVRLRQVRRREGQYLLRTNFPEPKGGSFWSLYTQLS